MVQFQSDFDIELQSWRLVVTDASIVDSPCRGSTTIPRFIDRLFFFPGERRPGHDTLVDLLGFLRCGFEFDADDGHGVLLQRGWRSNLVNAECTWRTPFIWSIWSILRSATQSSLNGRDVQSFSLYI